MNANLNEDSLLYLFKAITTLETVDECRRFFDDLCTVPELKAMSQRLMVAKLLNNGVVYSNYTSCEGYALVFDRLKKLEDKEEE